MQRTENVELTVLCLDSSNSNKISRKIFMKSTNYVVFIV